MDEHSDSNYIFSFHADLEKIETSPRSIKNSTVLEFDRLKNKTTSTSNHQFATYLFYT